MTAENDGEMPEPAEEWPAHGLESAALCPVCRSDRRTLLHGDLSDRIFGAPGTWNLQGCEGCGSAYLDPRPTPETVGRAYARYYTHEDISEQVTRGFKGKIRRILANGYRNHRFGTRDHPASRLGILAAALMPRGRAILDTGMRHLPKPVAGQRLLDVGCGNAGFLLRARSAGWNVVGVDFDNRAVETARRRGVDVRLGGVETIQPLEERFDVVTMAHVIEHVHDPVSLLRTCRDLLKPGGFLWLETPNLDSEGHGRFGAAWRGLEPPRHLVLFTFESLRGALREVGFSQVRIQPYRPMCDQVFRASEAIRDGVDPYLPQVCTGPTTLGPQIREAERIATGDPRRREFMTIKAWRT